MAEWRDRWEPFDPLRPCYTCGAAPAFWFDRERTEPGYRCEDHPPIGHDERYRDGTWSGKTTEEDYRTAYEYALRRLTENEEEGRESKFIPDSEKQEQLLEARKRDRQLERLTRSVLAEIFVARVTGLRWNRGFIKKGYRRKRKKADVGRNIEVRNSRFHDSVLSLYDNDPPDRLVVYVTGVNPFVARGWIRARNGKRPHLFRPATKKYPERWQVPQDLLLSMYEFPGE